jgi:hypothetical protein
VQTLASKIGATDHYALNSAPGPHGWTESTETASVDWMRAWLKDEKGILPLDCTKYRPLDIGFSVKNVDQGLLLEERGVTATKRTMDLPGARDIHMILRDRLAATLKARPAYSAAERNSIAAKLAGVRMPAEMKAVVKELATEELDDGTKLTRVAFVYPDGMELPACWLVPAKADAAKAPVLMVGAKDRGVWADKVKASLAGGASVLVADITGYGEIGKPNKIFYGTDDCPEEGFSAMLYLMGESMVGRRATDMLVLADWVKGKAGSAPSLAASGASAIAAAHARAADNGAFAKVEVSNAPKSWTELIETLAIGKDNTANYRYTYLVVNGLKHYDWPELLK